MTLIADGFLAGSLLTLLLPVALLLALVAWYLLFLRRVPESSVDDLAGASAAPNPGPAAPAAAAPNLPTTATPAPGDAPGGMAPPGTGQP